MTLLAAHDLVKRFPSRRNVFGRAVEYVEAVRGVGFTIDAGETVAMVGESGAGKSTIGRMVLRLVEPDAGTVHFDGLDVLAASRRQLRTFRRHAQIIFQDPYSSLDPRKTVGDSVVEPLVIHFELSRGQRHERALELLDRVGIHRQAFDRYPAELSGGQLQRVAIARALTLSPRLIVCDEPVAALDVSVQAQVLTLMKDLQADLGISYLFITHDLTLVEVIADRVIVMYKGAIEETGTVSAIFSEPKTPYTMRLLSAIPSTVPRKLRARPVEDPQS
jgi:ABC-type glutathione transport system ATPase component